MKIGIANDHTAVEMKKEVTAYLESLGHEVINFGTDSTESTDYPIWGEKVANAVASGEVEKGIAICGTGLGMAMCANKFPGIRAGVCHDSFSGERLALSNNGNVICFGERVIGVKLAEKILGEWLELEFVDGSSTPKVEAIKNIEKKTMK